MKKEVVPMARIERATSPLPRECSTTEPHGHRHGLEHAPGGDVQALDDAAIPACTCRVPSISLSLRFLERETGIEPVSLAWKAKVLPLNYSRGDSFLELCSAWWRRLDSNQRTR